MRYYDIKLSGQREKSPMDKLMYESLPDSSSLKLKKAKEGLEVCPEDEREYWQKEVDRLSCYTGTIDIRTMTPK